eukprot:4480528-Heterocapsa_arctica.AAC.1
MLGQWIADGKARSHATGDFEHMAGQHDAKAKRSHNGAAPRGLRPLGLWFRFCFRITLAGHVLESIYL